MGSTNERSHNRSTRRPNLSNPPVPTASHNPTHLFVGCSSPPPCPRSAQSSCAPCCCWPLVLLLLCPPSYSRLCRRRLRGNNDRGLTTPPPPNPSGPPDPAAAAVGTPWSRPMDTSPTQPSSSSVVAAWGRSRNDFGRANASGSTTLRGEGRASTASPAPLASSTLACVLGSGGVWWWEFGWIGWTIVWCGGLNDQHKRRKGAKSGRFAQQHRHSEADESRAAACCLQAGAPPEHRNAVNRNQFDGCRRAPNPMQSEPMLNQYPPTDTHTQPYVHTDPANQPTSLSSATAPWLLTSTSPALSSRAKAT